MAYKDMVLGTLTQTAIDERNNIYFGMAQEVEEVYRKAKAFDEIENILNNYFENYGCYPSPKEYVQEVVSVIDNYKERVDDER
ncbi:hypothetical protein [Staphylococcus nepalensis]|uniref:hypothetical protein n=1 Tax=Staphylococcus nepalensis TaxID=214473 RepID=UPI00301B3B6C